MKPIYVICFYWEGDRWQENKFNSSEVTRDISYRKHLNRVGKAPRELVETYINNLYQGIMKWTVHSFKFVCFTNEELELMDEIETRPFKMYATTGVLPRLYMFSKEAGLFGHQVLCLDIDVVITGPLRDIMNYKGLFAVRPRWQRREGHLPDGDIMSFRAGEETERIFWDPFIEDVTLAEATVKGRERFWITECIGDKWDSWANVAPGQVCSYKHHILRSGLKDARIVSCHGFPRPHQINEVWRKQNWKFEQYKTQN